MGKIVIIGAGVAGLSAACYMAREGYEVVVFEKNSNIGGRAQQLQIKGHLFDRGPFIYYRDHIYEEFFSDFNSRPEDHYEILEASSPLKYFDTSCREDYSPAYNSSILYNFPFLSFGSDITENIIPESLLYRKYRYIKGGMANVINGIGSLARELGVQIVTSAEINRITIRDGMVNGVVVNGRTVPSDLIISAADYHHTESLIPYRKRNYSEDDWKQIPTALPLLIFYAGFNTDLEQLSHNNIFHGEDGDYTTSFPFYLSVPTIRENPISKKNSAVLIMPLLENMRDDIGSRRQYLDNMVDRMGIVCGKNIKKDLEFGTAFGVSDFIVNYNAKKGNAIGIMPDKLSGTGLKTYNEKLGNLFYAGHYTARLPGMAGSILSGKAAALQAISSYKSKHKVYRTFVNL